MEKRAIVAVMLSLLMIFAAACGSSGEKAGSSSGTGGSTSPAGGGGSGKPVKVRIAHVSSETTSIHQAMLRFKEIAEEKSGGRIEVEVHPNATLGTSREQVEQVQAGLIEMVNADMDTLSSFVDSVAALSFPFLLPTTSGELFDLLDNKLFNTVSQHFEEKGFKFFGFESLGYKVITNNDRPIQSPDDLKGMKLRVLPSEVLTIQYEGWGAQPVAIDYTEVYTALQTGVVSGQENPLEAIYTMKFHEVQKYMSMTNHANRILTLLANLDWFNGLDPELREIVNEAGLAATRYQRELAAKEWNDYFEKLSAALEVNELTEEGLRQFKTASEPLYEKMLKTDKQRQLFDEIRSLYR